MKTARPRGLALNFVVLTAGEMVAKLLTFAAYSYLARVLGPARYGGFEFTMAVMIFFTLPVDLGLGSYGAREIARDPSSAPRLLRELMELRFVLVICSLAGLLAFTWFIPKSPEVKLLLIMYGAGLFLYPLLLQWFFQGHEQMQWVAAASIVRQAVFAGFVFIFVRPETPLVTIGAIDFVSQAAVALMCAAVVKFALGIQPRWPALHLSHAFHLRKSAPIGLTEVAWAFTWYFTTVLLGFLASDSSLGWYGASHRALMAMHTFVWLYFFNLLPSISRCAKEPVENLVILLRRSLKLAAWAGVCGAFLLSVTAGDLLILVYGPAYGRGGPAFAVLVWMLPVSMLAGHYGYTLIGYGLQKLLLYSTTLAAVLAVVLAFALVPPFGTVGAASALLIANIVNLLLQYGIVSRRVAVVPFHSALQWPVVGMVVAAALFAATSNWNIWMRAGAAGLGYATVLAICEGREALAFVRAMARRPEPEKVMAG